MKKTIILLALLFCIPAAHAQTCTGPAPCSDPIEVTKTITLTGTDTLCLGGGIGCIPVSYYKVPDDSGGYFVMARSVVTGESKKKFPIAVMSGICKEDWECKALPSEAKNSLQALALVVGRVQRSDSE